MASELLTELLRTWWAEALLRDADQPPDLLAAHQGFFNLSLGELDLTLLGVRSRRSGGRRMEFHDYRSIPEIPVPYPSARSVAPATNRRRFKVR